MLNIVERYFHEGHVPVTYIIYTDFLVTIMEAKKDVRETIKSMMGPETQSKYKELLTCYSEMDN